MLCLGNGGPAVAVTSAAEAPLKAAYLYNFTKFVRWPDTREGSANDPIQICIIRQVELVAVLRLAVRDKVVRGHRIAVRELAGAEEAAGCHMVYIPKTESRRVEDALAVNREALERCDITVIREFDELQAVNLDRHKVLQILVNLIRNAAQAMDHSGNANDTLTLRLKMPEADRVRIEVTDTGCGIEPENLARIFRHGFTTKRDGHGYGLHSSATTAQELHGSLQVESDGVGTGATFTLELPTLE